MVEELQATRVVEAQKVWDFLGQTEMALAPLSFSPVFSGEPAQEVSIVLPMLDSGGAKMLTLEEVISEQLESKGRILVEKVAEHGLTCFQSWNPNISLEPMVQGPTVEVKEAAMASIQDTAKIVAAQFQHQLNDT
jgi:hypothetical protein